MRAGQWWSGGDEKLAAGVVTRAILELRDLSCFFGVCFLALVILLRLNGAPYFVLRHDFRAVVSGRQSQISSTCLGKVSCQLLLPRYARRISQAFVSLILRGVVGCPSSRTVLLGQLGERSHRHGCFSHFPFDCGDGSSLEYGACTRLRTGLSMCSGLSIGRRLSAWTCVSGRARHLDGAFFKHLLVDLLCSSASTPRWYQRVPSHVSDVIF